MAKLQNVTRAHLGLLLANLVWAVNYPFYKVLMPHYITPVALATFAVTVAGLLGLVSLFWGGIEKIDRNDIYKFIGAALLMGIAKKLLLMIGMQHTSPSKRRSLRRSARSSCWFFLSFSGSTGLRR